MTTVKAQTYSYEDYLKLDQKYKEREKMIQEQLWIDRTISQFDDMLRMNYNKSLSSFSEAVIEHVAELTNAFSGVIYILEKNEDQEVLNARAAYACRLEDLKYKQVKIGDGVIGQAARSKKILFFDNLPPEHTEVKLNSIAVNAVNILVIPLIFNEKVYGVIELIHIIHLEPKFIELFQKLNRNIAVMIESLCNNLITKRLLQDSREQTEKLLAQEEELRQNLEELSTTQEALSKKEIELRGKVEAINLTLATVEFDMNGVILYANNLFLEKMGYKTGEIIGQHHALFLEDSYANSEKYKAFWEKLRSGKEHSDEFRRVRKNGQDIWLRATYTPILNSSGEPIKVVKLALDITEQKQQFLDFEGQLYAISKSSALVEFSLQGEILKTNQIFLDLFGYQASEVVGQHHRMFVQESDLKNEAYQQFWVNLRQGKLQNGEFKRKNKQGDLVWLRGSYNPILDLKGEPYKIVKVAQDITKLKMLEMKIPNFPS